LHGTEQDQRHRRENADRRIAGQKPDGSGSASHEENDRHEYRAASAKVRHSAEEQRTDRSNDQSCAVRGEGRQHDGRAIRRWKEQWSDDGGERSIESEVVPLHGIAKTNSDYGRFRGSDVARFFLAAAQ
jgi:hypothetical protein